MSQTANEINSKVEEKTGFGNYMLKEARTTAILIGGIAAGAGLGWLAARSSAVREKVKDAVNYVTTHVNKRLPAGFEPLKLKENTEGIGAALPILGGAAGATSGIVSQTYEHWREGKRTQLRVEEMTDDIIALREQRNAAMASLQAQSDEIGAQNAKIQAILAQGPKSAEQIAAHKPMAAKTDQVELRREQTAGEPPQLG